MEIRTCCENMKCYVDSLYIGVNSENNVTIDTALYDENEVEIEYCPFCGKKIELYSLDYIKRINSILEE